MVTDMLDTEARMVTRDGGMRYARGAKKTGEAVINSLKKAIRRGGKTPWKGMQAE